MGIRRARVTWFAVIHGLPAAGTTGEPYHQSPRKSPLTCTWPAVSCPSRSCAFTWTSGRRHDAAAIDHELVMRSA